MRKIGLIKALALTGKADKMSAAERTALQQKRFKELVSYVKENSPYFAELYKNPKSVKFTLKQPLPD